MSAPWSKLRAMGGDRKFRGRNLPSPAQADPPQPARFVATHASPLAVLRDWRSPGSAFFNFAQRFAHLTELLLASDEGQVTALLRVLKVQNIAGSDVGLRELGPKQKQGGTPRVFYMRHGRGSFILGAGVEKGSGGLATEIKTAESRGGQVLASFPNGFPPTNADVARILSAVYSLTEGKASA